MITRSYIIFFAFLQLFFLSSSAQMDEEGFEKSLKNNIDLDELSRNPVLDLQESDSLLDALNKGRDSAFDARFYHLLGKLNTERGNYRVAIEYFNTAREYRSNSSAAPFDVNNSLDMGNAYYRLNNSAEARKEYEGALEMATNTNDRAGMATAYNNLGLVELDAENHSGAQSFFERSLEIRRELEDPFLIGHSLGYLGMLHFRAEEYEEAVGY